MGLYVLSYVLHKSQNHPHTQSPISSHIRSYLVTFATYVRVLYFIPSGWLCPPSQHPHHHPLAGQRTRGIFVQLFLFPFSLATNAVPFQFLHSGWPFVACLPACRIFSTQPSCQDVIRMSVCLLEDWIRNSSAGRGDRLGQKVLRGRRECKKCSGSETELRRVKRETHRLGQINRRRNDNSWCSVDSLLVSAPPQVSFSLPFGI